MYQQNRKALIEYATPLLGSREEAEDVVQDAYFRFVPVSPEAPLPPKAYLFRIVRNLSFNKRSRRKRENAVHSDDIPWWALPQPVETPEGDLMFREQVHAAAEALQALPEKARLAMEMYRFDGLTLKQIAEALDISIPTAHRLLKDAMAAIKQQMQRRT
ncbi:RNA polymerase sigma factor [Rhizobium puerariae]|uniref:RNA polymerase sigma factor n=1 Tax=Rhizobium puerariae TaxID=1585791 RepID=A0ABV6AF90_9HYPH